ncbi:hypothetical protein QYM36_006549 [Artemia franciscana]|uniref:PiggyBac transposable element-derived protein domain-containing protein n=1 Tax=Artemia franciscana TaxID=6661 RepID=A0AA88I0L0_ARTSF|nr:hypothetical protein QYM36_006549 [Artemia franciscana]
MQKAKLPPLEIHQKLKKAERRLVDWRVEQHSSIVVTKWYDNKPVHVIPSYSGPYPTDQYKQWDKKSQAQIEANRPQVIKEYKKFMGGADLNNKYLRTRNDEDKKNDEDNDEDLSSNDEDKKKRNFKAGC